MPKVKFVKKMYRMRPVKKNIMILAIVWGVVGIIGCSGVQPDAPRAAEVDTARPAAPSVVNDDGYVAFRDAHEHSPKIPSMIVALAHKHMEAGQYLLARFYLNEYRRDFPSGKERDRIEYLGVRNLFLQYRQTKDDRFIAPFKAQAKAFREMFPRSPYRTKVQDLIVKMHQLQNAHYRELAKYYEGRGKPKAAAFYRGKMKN